MHALIDRLILRTRIDDFWSRDKPEGAKQSPAGLATQWGIKGSLKSGGEQIGLRWRDK